MWANIVGCISRAYRKALERPGEREREIVNTYIPLVFKRVGHWIKNTIVNTSIPLVFKRVSH